MMFITHKKVQLVMVNIHILLHSHVQMTLMRQNNIVNGCLEYKVLNWLHTEQKIEQRSPTIISNLSADNISLFLCLWLYM